jgi:hypothetical protein
MTQSQVNRAVARATGESLGTIIRRGFGIDEPGETDRDDDGVDMLPSVVDWDMLDAARALESGRRLPLAEGPPGNVKRRRALEEIERQMTLDTT